MEFEVIRNASGVEFIDIEKGSTTYKLGSRKPSLLDLATLPWGGRAAELNLQVNGAIRRAFSRLHIERQR